MSREWRLDWRDVIECCRKIERYAAGMDLDAFKADERTYDAVVRNVELIGEAVKALPEDARALAPQIEWRRIAGMRDFVAHVYFGINDMILWEVVTSKVPELLAVMERIDITSTSDPNGP